MSRHVTEDFRITIKTLPDNWGDILLRLCKEGIWGSELMCHKDANDAFPIPWDGTLYFENGECVLDGHAQCHGTGTCKVTFPKNTVDQFMEYTCQVYQEEFDGDFIDRFRAILDKYNVEYVEGY